MPPGDVSPQVAALTDEREKLNAFAQELTERCTSHEDDMGRLRNAFTALAEHVDAEIGRLDAEGRKTSTEASGLHAQIDLLKASAARTDQELSADRARFDQAGVQADEAVRNLAAEIDDLRREIAGVPDLERQIGEFAGDHEARREVEARSREDEARSSPWHSPNPRVRRGRVR
jgi:chromosome segregation ATPase